MSSLIDSQANLLAGVTRPTLIPVEGKVVHSECRCGMAGRLALMLVLTVVAGCSSFGRLQLGGPDLRRQIMVTLERPQLASPGIMSYSESSAPVVATRSAQLPVGILSKRIARMHGLQIVDSWGIDALGVDVYVYELGEDVDLDEVVDSLSSDQQIESVQVVNRFRTLAYNDPYFYLQEAGKHDSIEKIHAFSTGKGVMVGIIDTGIDRQHPELKDRIVYAGNFVAHDQQRFDGDLHGTAVAGVIAAKANNDQGIVGVAPGVSLMAFKACWQKDLLQTECDSFSLVKALVKALELKPDVLNLSLSGPEDPLVRRMIKKASQQGMIIIGAVDQALGVERSFPANMPEVIAVASGPQASGSGNRRGLIAPGTDILTTAPGAEYAFESGSSMSTAHVSGIAALLKEMDPQLAGKGVRDLLNHTARVWDAELVVDMCAALMQLSNDTVCTSNLLVRNRDGALLESTN